MKSAFLALLLLGAPAVGLRAAEPVRSILDDQEHHGYRSPALAVERLKSAASQLSGRTPVPDREAYYAAIAYYAFTSRDPALVADGDRSVAALLRMAKEQGCTDCLVDARLAQAESAVTRRDPDAADRFLAMPEPPAAAGRGLQRFYFHYLRARLYNIRGNFTAGIAEALQAAEVAERRGDAAGRLTTEALLVSMATALGDYHRADSIAEKAYAEARQLGFGYAMATLRNNQAFAYGLSGRPALQGEALDEALRLSQGQRGMEQLEAVILTNLADHWLLEKDYAKALDYGRRSMALARRSGDTRNLAYAMTNVGVATAYRGDTDAGIAYVRQAIGLAESMGARSDVLGVTGELVGIYKRAGRYREALETTERIDELRRDLTRQERDKTVLEMQERYASQAREREIERLSAANRIKQAEVDAQRWQQRLWAALALVLALAAIPLVQWLGHTRRANRKLSGDIHVLAEASSHDALTGVFNRRYGQALLGKLSERASTEAGQVGLVLLDIDFFKRVNDTHGHAAGDRVLVALGQRLTRLLRQQDAVVRWGGEEFALILPAISPEGLAGLTRRLLHAVSDEPIDIGSASLMVTVSAGCITYPLAPPSDWHDLMHVADLALYRSKSGGRNRATVVSTVSGTAALDSLSSDLDGAVQRGAVEIDVIEGPAASAGAITEKAAASSGGRQG